MSEKEKKEWKDQMDDYNKHLAQEYISPSAQWVEQQLKPVTERVRRWSLGIMVSKYGDRFEQQKIHEEEMSDEEVKQAQQSANGGTNAQVFKQRISKQIQAVVESKK